MSIPKNINHHFISFEGIDFCGKSTQVASLIEFLKSRNEHVHLLREPGGTAVSERVRNIVLDPAHPEMCAQAEILLYSAARAQLVHQEIIPLLEAGNYVIADRYFDSTSAYQGSGRNLDLDFVNRLNNFATSNLTPYKTLLIDITVDESARRQKLAGRQKDRLESEAISFQETVRAAYHKIAASHPDRFIIVDGMADIETVKQSIHRAVAEIWKL